LISMNFFLKRPPSTPSSCARRFVIMATALLGVVSSVDTNEVLFNCLF